MILIIWKTKLKFFLKIFPAYFSSYKYILKGITIFSVLLKYSWFKMLC